MNQFKVFLVLTILLVATAEYLHAQDLSEGFKNKQPVKISGALDIRSIMYNSQGIAARRSPFTYIFNTNATLELYQVSIPFAITFSEQERAVSQPFNQFGLSPKYKWVQVHLGYRNLNFSPYTLAGHTMLGGGFELTPKNWRIGFMYGRLNKATTIDTSTGIVQPYSFSRKGIAAKIGYGTNERNIELSMLSAKDDSNSIQKNIPDTLRTVNPAGNAVFSLRGIFTFYKKLFVEADAGSSVYTYDVGSQLGASDDLEKINSYSKGLVRINTTTQANFAYTASIGYKEKNWSIKASYRHIDPEFQSMGAYFFQNDLENYTIGGSFNALKNKLRFNGSIGQQKDNLRKQKTAQTTRLIGNANLSVDFTDRLGIDASYINYSANATPNIVNVNNKYMLAQTTHNASITPRYILSKTKVTHVVIASYNYSVLNDQNKETSVFNNINTNVIFLTYSFTQNKSGFNITTGINQASTKFYTGTVNNYGGTISTSKNFLKSRLQSGISVSYSRTDQFGAASVINSGLNASYSAGKHNKFGLRYNLLYNQPDKVTIGNPKYTENTAELAYTLNF